MEYVYPAIFHENDDKSYTVTFPDLPGCISEDKTLTSAIKMAGKALSQWIEYLTDKGEALPKATPRKGIKAGRNEFVNLILADVRDAKAVRRTVSIPKWMDEKAVESGLSLSRILQDALNEKLSQDADGAA